MMRKTPLILIALLTLNTGYVTAQEVVRPPKSTKEGKAREESRTTQNNTSEAQNNAAIIQELRALIMKSARGDPEAMYQMGRLHQAGVYFEKDIEEALEYFENAAEVGYAPAMYQIGGMHFVGTDIKQDTPTAITWLKKAVDANKDFLPAYLLLGYIYLEPTPRQTRDLKQAEYYYGYAAKRGNIEGMAYLGEVFSRQKKFDQALPYLTKAADEGNAVAKVNLADMYFYGKGVEKDIDRAMEYARAAIEAKDQPMSPGNAKVAGIIYQQASLKKMRQYMHKDDE